MTDIRKFFLTFLAIYSALTLTSCAEIVVKEVHWADTPEMPHDASPTPIKFSRLRFLLPPGTEIGLESGMGPVWLGGICSLRNYPVSRRILSRRFESAYIKETFATAMGANGYDVVESLDIDFRPEDEADRAEYFISARVKDVDLDLCKRGRFTAFNIFNTAPGAKGKMYVQIDWSVYDALRRTVVYKTTTEGYTRRDYPNIEGLELLFFDAFEMASHNLAADPGFYDLIVKNKKPSEGWREKGYGPKLKPRPRKYNAREVVDLPARKLSRQPLPKHIKQARDSVVMVQKSGHGTGFFITEDGHILTNHHVVGEAQRMRVVTNGKSHSLIAEVLRVDRARDMALLKLEDIPKSLKINPLPIRTDKMGISEDVYAIGTPRDYRALQGTVTKGIVSAHRAFKIDGVRLQFIQADVETHGGNSGGPLLDEYGNIIGVSVRGYHVPNSSFGVGLNYFVPIGEALRVLDITLDGRKAETYSLEDDKPGKGEFYLAPAPLTSE